MVFINNTVVALALAAAVAFAISLAFRSKPDPREPPVLHSTIPFIGHVIGMLREGPLYLLRVSANNDAPIFTLPMLGSHSYICRSPAIAAAIQRASTTLDFDWIVVRMTPRMIGSNAETRRLLLDPLAVDGKRSIADEAHHVTVPPLNPQNIDGISTKQVKHFENFANSIQDGQEVELFKLATYEIAAASMETFYGPEDPFKLHPELMEAFWDWEDGIVGYMIDILPAITARKAYLGFERCLKGFEEYVEAGRSKDAYTLIQNREQMHMRAGITKKEHARLELGLAFAFNTNAGITAFWLLNNVWRSPELLADVREEIQNFALLGSDTLSYTRLRDHCPLLNSVYRETMRMCAPMTSARYVNEDTLVADRHLLRKGAFVQIAGGVIHKDPAIWGADVESFNPRRFLKSATGTKVMDDGNSNKTESVHPAAFRAFGGGSSLCPGRHFAKMEILSLSAVLLLGFDAVAPEGQRNVKWDPKVDDKRFPFAATKPMDKLHVRLKRNPEYASTKWKMEVRASAKMDLASL